MTYAGSSFRQTQGTISGNGQSVTLTCPGAASATIQLSGTFTGTVEVVGAATSAASANGGRIIFKSGVGSLGTNTLPLSGTLAEEWRVVVGGNSVSVRCTAYTSGTLTARIGATNNPSIVFVNGPVHDDENEAVRAGRAYVGSTANVDVSANNVLDIRLANPSNSGRNLFVLRRRFSNFATTSLEYTAYSAPNALGTPVAGNLVNRRVGGAGSSATFNYQVRSAATAMGGTAGAAEILPAGQLVIRTLLSVVPPGSSIGFRMQGSGGNLQNQARLGCTLEWYEEPVA